MYKGAASSRAECMAINKGASIIYEVFFSLCLASSTGPAGCVLWASPTLLCCGAARRVGTDFGARLGCCLTCVRHKILKQDGGENTVAALTPTVSKFLQCIIITRHRLCILFLGKNVFYLETHVTFQRIKICMLLN